MDYTTLTKKEVTCLKELVQIFRNYSNNYKVINENEVFGIYNDSLQKWWDNIEKYYDNKWINSFLNKMIGFNFLSEEKNGKSIRIDMGRNIYFNENNISRINFAIAQRKSQKKNKILNFVLNVFGGFIASVLFGVINKIL